MISEISIIFFLMGYDTIDIFTIRISFNTITILSRVLPLQIVHKYISELMFTNFL